MYGGEHLSYCGSSPHNGRSSVVWPVPRSGPNSTSAETVSRRMDERTRGSQRLQETLNRNTESSKTKRNTPREELHLGSLRARDKEMREREKEMASLPVASPESSS